MTEAKKNHLRTNRYARYRYLFLGGKHKLDRFQPDRTVYVWCARPEVGIRFFDRKSGYYETHRSIVEDSRDYQFALSAMHN